MVRNHENIRSGFPKSAIFPILVRIAVPKIYNKIKHIDYLNFRRNASLYDWIKTYVVASSLSINIALTWPDIHCECNIFPCLD